MDFKFPKGCKVLRDGAEPESLEGKRLVMREEITRDRLEAKRRARATDSDEGIELLRLSIVEVDGRRVEQPYMDLNFWNLRAQQFADSCWLRVNLALEADEAASPLP